MEMLVLRQEIQLTKATMAGALLKVPGGAMAMAMGTGMGLATVGVTIEIEGNRLYSCRGERNLPINALTR